MPGVEKGKRKQTNKRTALNWKLSLVKQMATSCNEQTKNIIDFSCFNSLG